MNYANMAKLAQRLIDKNGRNLIIQMIKRAPTDSAAPWDGSTGTDSSITVKGVVTPYTFEDVGANDERFSYKLQLIRDNIRRGDAQCFIAADDTQALPVRDFDTVLDGTELWKVIQADPLKPGDTTIIYTLHLRK